MIRVRAFVFAGIVALLAGPAPQAAAAPKEKGKKDLVWVHPAFDSLSIVSIAMLPSAAFDNDLADEKIVDLVVAQGLNPLGYRWISTSVSRDLLRRSFGGDSVLKALDRMLLDRGRIDSLVAPLLAGALRTKAMLSVRIELFEQVTMEWNQAGKPSTTVQLRAALVDSMGRLLWTASGSETADGPYHDPLAGTLGVKGSGLGSTPMTNQGGPPSFEEVLSRLVARWVAKLPRRKTTS
jgi:hypothetical protein